MFVRLASIVHLSLGEKCQTNYPTCEPIDVVNVFSGPSFFHIDFFLMDNVWNITVDRYIHNSCKVSQYSTPQPGWIMSDELCTQLVVHPPSKLNTLNFADIIIFTGLSLCQINFRMHNVWKWTVDICQLHLSWEICNVYLKIGSEQLCTYVPNVIFFRSVLLSLMSLW
jgi:hypothetical protein